MTERNNRRAYHQPTRDEVAEIRKDPRNVRWRTLWRIAVRQAGTKLTWLQVHDMLDLKQSDHVMIGGKPVYGWWRFP